MKTISELNGNILECYLDRDLQVDLKAGEERRLTGED